MHEKHLVNVLFGWWSGPFLRALDFLLTVQQELRVKVRAVIRVQFGLVGRWICSKSKCVQMQDEDDEEKKKGQGHFSTVCI